MKARILVILFIACAASAISATPIRIISDHANDVGKLLGRYGVNEQTVERIGVDSLKSLLVGEGYLDAEVALEKDKVEISAGPIYSFDRVEVEGDSIIAVGISGTFTRASLEEAVNSVLEQYYAQGFYFARATVSALERNGKKISVRLQVTPGPVVALSRLVIEGLGRTKSGVVERELMAQPGDTLTEALLTRIERHSRAVKYLQYLPPITITPLSGYGQADITVRFAERPQVNLAGGVGYQNDQAEALLWNLSLQVPNLFGEGKHVSLRSERRQKGRNLLDLTYSQPSNWLGRSQLRAEISTRDYREQFYEFTARAGIDIELAQGSTLGLLGGWKRVEPVDSSGYSRYEVGLGFERSVLDDPVNPSTGYVLNTSVTYAYRTVDEDSTRAGRGFNNTRASLSAELFRPLLSGLVLKTQLGYRGVETQDKSLPISELFWFGGPGSLRGYQQEQFAAQRGAFAAVEPRWRFTGGYLFGFWDGAFLQIPLSGETADIYRQGFGGGIALVTHERAIQLSLGWNPDLSFDQPYLSVAFLSGL